MTVELLLSAYAQGYFPMGQPESAEVLWFNPDPRAILPLDGFHVSRSLAREIKKPKFEVTYDKAFHEVMKCCADREETWITEEFFKAYQELHELGFAHSVEVWADGQLVGGTYGITLGAAFFAESKFHRKTNASKLALYFLVERLKAKKFQLLEVQFLTDHLKRLGAKEIPKSQYLSLLHRAIHAKAYSF